jgi:hypothetical protein
MSTFFQTYGIDAALPELLVPLAVVSVGVGELAVLPGGGARQATVSEKAERDAINREGPTLVGDERFVMVGCCRRS